MDRVDAMYVCFLDKVYGQSRRYVCFPLCLEKSCEGWACWKASGSIKGAPDRV